MPAATPHRSLPGYEEREVLGRGGMGEVTLAVEEEIGRQVAIKRMRSEDPRLIQRFLREAKIQARLDHPAIVPVHRMGIDQDGRPYFTMKRLSGRTLAEVIPHATVQRLLRVFVDVCEAIDFAHERGVVHRDLKPANVMVGSHGEVYVLDWGIARVLGEADIDPSGAISGDGTQAGTLLGTPGYMAPEQVMGNAEQPADVYGLGCILFECLARVPFRDADGPSPAALASDLPPELDALCIAALAEDPAQRPTARQLAERVQGYLDGDRDLEQRRALASGELRRARILLSSGDRAGAIHAAGRAMALDPQSEGAALVTKLMLEPPETLPPELEAHLRDVDDAFSRGQWRKVMAVYLVFLPAFGLIAMQGVRDALTFGLAVGSAVVLAAMAALAGLRGVRIQVSWLVASLVSMILISRTVGDLIILPAFLCMMINGLSSWPYLIRVPWVPIGLAILAFAIPLVLHQLGVWSSTWSIVDGGILSHPPAVGVDPAMTTLFVIGSHVTLFVILGLFAWSLSNDRRAAQRLVEIRAWHLRKLLPAEA